MGGDLTKKIGFFGGTFDPPHFGHLNLAIEMQERKGLDEVLFSPAYLSPFKQNRPPIPDPIHRLKMVELMIKDIPSFKVVDWEIRRQAPSYTIDILEFLIRGNPQSEICLLLGGDALEGFEKWHRVEDIVRLVPLLIGSRLHGQSPIASGNSLVLQALEQGMVKTRIMEISATDLRNRLEKKLYCGHLLPKEVLDYIKQFDLY